MATIEAEIQHRNSLYHLHITKSSIPTTSSKETKVMVYKAACTTTLQEQGVGYISKSSEDYGELPPKLPKKDSLYPMAISLPQRQCLLGGQHNYSIGIEAMIRPWKINTLFPISRPTLHDACDPITFYGLTKIKIKSSDRP